FDTFLDCDCPDYPTYPAYHYTYFVVSVYAGGVEVPATHADAITADGTPQEIFYGELFVHLPELYEDPITLVVGGYYLNEYAWEVENIGDDDLFFYDSDIGGDIDELCIRHPGGDFACGGPVPVRYEQNTPVPINGGECDASVLVVADDYNISDINLGFNIDCVADWDYEIYLHGPNGITARICSRIGSGGPNFYYTIIDDEAPTDITEGDSPYSGTFRPQPESQPDSN
ncbi:MAG: hypothetical protein GY869_17520, partial [Planctomycetes bacterium]|nr:hypothetical protein [Planctomycetota bacterium]